MSNANERKITSSRAMAINLNYAPSPRGRHAKQTNTQKSECKKKMENGIL